MIILNPFFSFLINRLCHQLNIFWRHIKLNQYFLYMRQYFLNISLPSSIEKLILSFCLLLWKKLANSKNRSESRLKSLFRLSFALLGRFFPLYIHCRGFRNNFQDHRRVTEQLLKMQAAIRKPIQALWSGLLEGISQLVSYFIEASRNFIWISFTKRQP